MTAGNDARFANIERAYEGLKAQLISGKLTREQFEGELQKMMLQDEQGRYWMMGAESGKWYMYEGQKWMQAEPPKTSAAGAVSAAPSTSEPSSQTRDDALTMASFTPPQTAQSTTPVSSDATETNAGFTPPQPAASETKTADTPDTQASFTPPQGAGAASAAKVEPPDTSVRDSAMTMPSFTPPWSQTATALTSAANRA